MNRDADPGYTAAENFAALADALLAPAPGIDRTSLMVRAEASEFLRFNHGALRQATSVHQALATLSVERGLRRTESTLSLCGRPAIDAARLLAERTLLAGQLELIRDDPWLRRPESAARSVRDERGRLPEAARVIALVHGLAGGAARLDLVGFYAGGPVAHAFADSLGSRHWHRVETFRFGACLYHRADKAVQFTYAGSTWDDAACATQVEAAARRLHLLERQPQVLAPGRYRTAFAPAAVQQLVGLLGWGGFSLKDRRTGVSPLMRLAKGQARLAAAFDLDEAPGAGAAPVFNDQGFVRPPRIALVAAGQLPADGGTLNSPRSAAEYGLACNGADRRESPEALRLAPGGIAHDGLFEALDHGLYVSNLWYLNFSDRAGGRATGMTRFACLWVEDGQPRAPVDVMRFDDDLLHLFGDGLLGLTDRAETFPNDDTYGARQLGSVTTPGALVDALQLTL